MRKKIGRILKYGGRGMIWFGEWLYDTGEQLESEEERKTEAYPLPRPKEKNYIHLSLLDNLLKRYNLPDNSVDSFFELTTCLINDGRKYALERMKNKIERDIDDLKKAKAVIDEFKILKSNQKRMDGLKLGIEKGDSPRIYMESVKKYLQEFNLEEKARRHFPDTIIDLLQNFYNKGKDDFLQSIQSNINALEKYLAEKDNEGVREELQRIKRKIKR
ncbi:MAG: hypothetical protein ACPL7I_06335 [Myxococcota bacterium]